MDPSVVSETLSTTFLTTEMLEPIAEAVTSNLAVVIPVGLGVFGIITAFRIGINMFRNLLHG